MTRKAYSLFTAAAISSLLLVGCDTAPDGGGDATAAALSYKHANKYTFLFTGGGATLAALGCGDLADLPGLKVLF